MDKKFIKLGDAGIELNKIKTDINRRVLNTSYVTEMLKNIRPLCILLPKMSAYRRDETEYMSLLIKR